jgi:hypothetical protein
MRKVVSYEAKRNLKFVYQEMEDSDDIVNASHASKIEGNASTKENHRARKEVLPVVKERKHLLDALPQDLRTYFLHRHYLGEKESIPKIASNLRFYARISRAHRDEVAQVLRKNEFREVAFAATSRALPIYMRKGFEQYISKKIKPEQRLHQLIHSAPRLQATLSFAEQIDAGPTKFKENRAPNLTLKRLLRAPGLRDVRLNLSGPTDTDHHLFKAFQPDDNFDVYLFDSIMSMQLRHLGMLIRLGKEIKGLIARGKEAPAMELIYRHWPETEQIHNLLALLSTGGPDSFLKKLDLSFGLDYEEMSRGKKNPKNDDLAQTFIDPLCRFLKINTSLTELVLIDARLGRMSAPRLVLAISANTGLQIVNLSRNYLGKAGVLAMGKALESNKTLERLALDTTGIDDQGATTLMAALKNNASLLHLSLADNKIRADHAIWSDARVSGRPKD